MTNNCIDPELKQRIINVVDLNVALLNHEISSLKRMMNKNEQEIPSEVENWLEGIMNTWAKEKKEFEQIQEKIGKIPTC